jgi:hypothetical protein
MRWGALFDDLESQLMAAERAALEAQAADLVRAEQALLGLQDRLRAHEGAAEFVLRGGLRVRGRVAEVAEDWCAIEEPPKNILISARGVVSVSGLGRSARMETSRVRRTLSLGSALRALARDRALIACHVDAGKPEALVVSGMIDVVGRDYVEIAVSRTDDWAREMPRRTTMLPLAGIIAVVSPA